MKYIKKYKKFKESLVVDLTFQNVEELLESLNLWHDALLNAISAEEVDIYNTFKLPQEMSDKLVDLDTLSDNVEFINSLSSLSLKKSEVNDTESFQTFLNKPCKFMFVFDINSNELENPIYLLFQVWNETTDSWEGVKLYKVKDDVKKFYDKLTSRTIEILDGDENYIYRSDNANEWILQDTKKENDVYKKTFRRDELKDFLKERNVKVNII